jgi:Ca2+-binding RTX toxin-like protein
MSGGNGNDLMLGSGGEDRLAGNNGNDRLFGLGGHDWLDGGRGHDQLDGGSGRDVLIGGQGDDRLTGGIGADTFSFDIQSGNDIILDFNTSEDQLSFTSGTGVRTTRVADYNGDGTSDLWLSLTGGGSVILYGVSSLSEVPIAATPAITGADDTAMGWALQSAHDGAQVNNTAGDQFAYGF